MYRLIVKKYMRTINMSRHSRREPKKEFFGDGRYKSIQAAKKKAVELINEDDRNDIVNIHIVKISAIAERQPVPVTFRKPEES